MIMYSPRRATMLGCLPDIKMEIFENTKYSMALKLLKTNWEIGGITTHRIVPLGSAFGISHKLDIQTSVFPKKQH